MLNSLSELTVCCMLHHSVFPINKKIISMLTCPITLVAVGKKYWKAYFYCSITWFCGEISTSTCLHFITFSSKCTICQVSSKSIDQRLSCDIPSTCWAQSCVSCCRYDSFCCCGTRHIDRIRQCQRWPDSSYIQLLATLNYDYRYECEDRTVVC